MKAMKILRFLAGAGIIAISTIGLVTGISISMDEVYSVIRKTEEITETIDEI